MSAHLSTLRVACYINGNHLLTSVFIGREIKVVLLNYVAKRMAEDHVGCVTRKGP